MAKIKIYDKEMAAGDLQEMRRLYNSWKTAANERIKTSAKPKNVEHASAYKHVVKPLKGAPYMGQRGDLTVFRAIPKDASARQVREAYNKMAEFMSAKTSTVSGMMQVMDERRQNIRDITGTSLSNAQADSLLRFLGSPEGKEALSKYDSDLVVQALSMDMEASPGAGSVLERWQAWESSGASLADWIAENEGGYEEF